MTSRGSQSAEKNLVLCLGHEQSCIPGGQAVDGVGGCLGPGALPVVATALGEGGLGGGPRNHVVGRPGGLVRGGGQRSPLQPGVLDGDRGSIWRGWRGKLPHSRGGR